MAKPGNKRGTSPGGSSTGPAARLERLFAVIVEHARQNPSFGQRLVDAFGDSAATRPAPSPRPPARTPPAVRPTPPRPAPKPEPPEPARKRRPAVIDPFALYDQGWESMLREHLSRLSADQLHDVIDQYRLDPQSRVTSQDDPDKLRDWIVRAVEDFGLSG